MKVKVNLNNLRKNKGAMYGLLAISILVIATIGGIFNLSYLSQYDISWQIRSVHLEFYHHDKEKVYDRWLEPRAVSFSYTPNRYNEKQENNPRVLGGGTEGSLIDNGTTVITAKNNTQYKVFWYDVQLELFIKAEGREPRAIKDWLGRVVGWEYDDSVKVSLWLELKSRGNWRLLDAYTLDINESLIITHSTAGNKPDNTWVDGTWGSVSAEEPSLKNQQIKVDGAGTQYSKDADEFFSALTLVDGKKLVFRGYLKPPELHKWDWLKGDLYAYGDSLIIWRFAVRVATAVPLEPSTAGHESLEDHKPDLIGANEGQPLEIPLWFWAFIAVLVAIVVVSIARAKKQQPVIVVNGG